METIAKIRRAYFAQNTPIKTICRELRRFLNSTSPSSADRRKQRLSISAVGGVMLECGDREGTTIGEARTGYGPPIEG